MTVGASSWRMRLAVVVDQSGTVRMESGDGRCAQRKPRRQLVLHHTHQRFS